MTALGAGVAWTDGVEKWRAKLAVRDRGLALCPPLSAQSGRFYADGRDHFCCVVLSFL